jgi:predicted ABC-type ATPase
LSSIKNPSLRLRIFAGPNGSGKSTIIKAVREYKIHSVPVDFGTYVNADDIAFNLRANKFSFGDYKVRTDSLEFSSIVLASGLVNKEFTRQQFLNSFNIKSDRLQILKPGYDERLAQILAHFLREKLLTEKRKFSFETVFSHSSKLDIMRMAKQAGYKVYLYFVSTESPDINKFRVKLRNDKGGHDVPSSKIESRYYRSLEFLFEASQLSYQTFFFDNTIEGETFKLFAHFKVINGKKKWDILDYEQIPDWFTKYYLEKVKT